MIVTYIRSSLLGSFDLCEQQTFIQYNLGYYNEPNVKTVVGTMTHKVMEILSCLKKAYQDTGLYSYEDADFGLLSFKEEDFLKETIYSFEEVEFVNKERIDKDFYIDIPRLKMPYSRVGLDIVEGLILMVYNYYVGKNTHIKFLDKHFQWCRNCTWLLLENKNYDPRLRDIVAPEGPFDLEIDEPWANYTYLIDDKRVSSKLRIKGTIDLVTKIDDETYEIIDLKGLHVDTPITTIDGWKTMGSLNIGDQIFDEYGNPTKILFKSTKKLKPCYKIEFDDKSEVVCDDEHLWKLNDSSIVTTLDLKVKDYISIAKPIITPDIELPIDPYLLGYWLGNGRNRGGEICGPDPFVFEEIRKRGYYIGKDISSRHELCKAHTIYELTGKLRKLNLLHNKHIPSIYLRASYKQRLDLLRGLMDSDGYVNSCRKQASFSSCNKHLSDNVKELILSLGQRPNQAKVNSFGFGLHVVSYPINFRPININPFLVPRKADKIDSNWGVGKSNKRQIRKINYVGYQETQCIKVDSPTSTYLCTENMIPTHNTGKRHDWAKEEEKTYAKLCKDKQLMLYYYAARRLYPNIKTLLLTINFVRDGGAYTISIDDESIKETLEILKQSFNKIRATEYPKLLDYYHKHFLCRMCTFFKTKIDGESQCSNIMKFNKRHGLAKTIEKYKATGFNLDRYSPPG